MKRSALSAIFLVSLMLSQAAPCAAAEPARGPLTAAEKAQCRALLTELKQSVRAVDADAEALKTLEADVGASSAAIDQERAAIDRRDSAAIQALNAHVARNNEMVKRHNQLAELSETKSIENQKRAAQHYDKCENRPEAPPAPPTTQP